MKLIPVIVIALLAMAGCHRSKGAKEIDSHQLTRNCTCVSFNDDVVIINIEDLAQVDTFDAHEIIGANYAYRDPLRIKIKSEDDIIKAEKVTYFYPTIWAGVDDDIMQFIYLFNLVYRDVMPLKIDNGIIEYPLKTHTSATGLKKSSTVLPKTRYRPQ